MIHCCDFAIDNVFSLFFFYFFIFFVRELRLINGEMVNLDLEDYPMTQFSPDHEYLGSIRPMWTINRVKQTPDKLFLFHYISLM